jgi:cytochrome c-type biogenesis protein CcmH
MNTHRFVLFNVVAPAFVALSALSASLPEAEVREIEGRFIAPCCWHENLAVHDSPIAREMRQEIEKLAASGKTESEIVDYYVARYGERILRVPRGTPYWFLLVTPFLALGAGAFWVVHYLSREVPSGPATHPHRVLG